MVWLLLFASNEHCFHSPTSLVGFGRIDEITTELQENQYNRSTKCATCLPMPPSGLFAGCEGFCRKDYFPPYSIYWRLLFYLEFG